MTPQERYERDVVFRVLTDVLWRWGFTAHPNPWRTFTLMEALERQGIRITDKTDEEGSKT